jgi:cytochrome c-type biogenesis protein
MPRGTPPSTSREGAGALEFAAAFLGGVLAFFSPCAWPLYPAYLAELAVAGRHLLPRTVLFALGFAAAFVALGATASAVGAWLQAFHLPLRQLSGLAIAACGLAVAGVLPWPGPRRTASAHPQPTGPWGAVLLGLGFGFGWTPCVGPVLGAILALAASRASAPRGAALLAAYALGFAAPLIALAALGARVRPRLGRRLALAQRAGGILLAALGAAVFAGGLDALGAFLTARL